MNIKDSVQGCAILKFLKSPVLSPKPKSRVRIYNNYNSNNADHGEICVQN